MIRPLRQFWTQLSLVRKSLVVIGLPVLALCGAGLMSLLYWQQGRAVDARIAQAYRAQLHLQDAQRLLLSASSSASGYLLSHDGAFLDEFRVAHKELEARLDDFATLPADAGPELAGRLEREMAALSNLLMLAAPPVPLEPRLGQQVLEEHSSAATLQQKVNALAQAQQHELDALGRARAQLLQNYYRLIAFGSLVGLLSGLIGMQLFASSITRRVQLLTANAKRLSRAVTSKPLPPSHDEIGQLGDALEVAGRLLLSREGELRQVNEVIRSKFDELTERHQHLVVLNQLAAALQQSASVTGALDTLRERLRALLPGASGELYLYEEESGLYRPTWQLGDEAEAAALEPLPPASCLALPGGHHYSYARDPESRPCPHLALPYPVASLCLSLSSQNRALGLLHLRRDRPFSEDMRHILHAMTDHFALALVNLRLRDSLKEQAIRDPLTGLYNRRHLQERLAHEIERVKRSGEPLSLLMADLDHFKRVNDRFGHDVGDAVLKATAALLERSFRAQDIPCRYGGEEFVILLPGTPLADAQRRAKRLVKQMRELVLEGAGRDALRLSVSIGVAGFPEHGAGERLIARADAALYRAKDLGRDRSVLYEPDIDRASPELTTSDPRD